MIQRWSPVDGSERSDDGSLPVGRSERGRWPLRAWGLDVDPGTGVRRNDRLMRKRMSNGRTSCHHGDLLGFVRSLDRSVRSLDRIPGVL